jgi:phage I-like protein
MKNILIILKELSGAPNEFQVLPAGTIEIEGDGAAFLDEQAATEIIAAFKARGNDMVIDYEHRTLDDVEAPAAGWIKALTWKPADGLWATVEWTKRAAEYLSNREYRYFSPVMLVREGRRTVAKLINVALTNSPRINHLQPIVSKWDPNRLQINQEESGMKKIRELLGLAADADDAAVEAAVAGVVAKNREQGDAAGKVVACKEVMDALGAKEGAGKDEVVQIVASLKAPADVAKTLSLEVATLKTRLAAMEQEDLVALALKEGKTSPEELDKWGRDLAGKAPEQFRQIVLSRPAGSVIPVERLIVAKDTQTGALADDVQAAVNRMMGVDAETFKKYNK